jgi:hypothetical protein
MVKGRKTQQDGDLGAKVWGKKGMVVCPFILSLYKHPFNLQNIVMYFNI